MFRNSTISSVSACPTALSNACPKVLTSARSYHIVCVPERLLRGRALFILGKDEQCIVSFKSALKVRFHSASFLVPQRKSEGEAHVCESMRIFRRTQPAVTHFLLRRSNREYNNEQRRDGLVTSSSEQFSRPISPPLTSCRVRA